MTRDAAQLRRDISARLAVLGVPALELLDNAARELVHEAQRALEHAAGADGVLVCSGCDEPVVAGDCGCTRMVDAARSVL